MHLDEKLVTEARNMIANPSYYEPTPKSVISTDQREWRNPLMQSVMQMFVARFASRNPCILRMFVLQKKPKVHAVLPCQRCLA